MTSRDGDLTRSIAEAASAAKQLWLARASATRRRLLGPFDQHDSPSSASVFLRVALPLLVLYLLTASWTLPYHIDTITNVFTAWELGTDGDVFLEDHEVLAVSRVPSDVRLGCPCR